MFSLFFLKAGEKLNSQNEATRKLKRHFRSDPERIRQLRLKFVQQAKEYFGVPYKKINFPPDCKRDILV